MDVQNIQIVNSHHGINQRMNPVQNVNIRLWLKNGKRTKTPRFFAQNADLKKLMQPPKIFCE